MKRIISIFCICMLVLGAFQIAYAGSGKVKDNATSSANTSAIENTNEKGNANTNASSNANEKENANSKVNDKVAIKEEVEALNEQINQNKEEIIKRREEMNSLTVSIQSKVTKLSSGKTTITQAKATNLITVTSIIKSSKKDLIDFKSDGFKKCISEGKTAREDKQFDKARDHINKALKLQEKRIKTLNSVINDLKTADQLL